MKLSDKAIELSQKLMKSYEGFNKIYTGEPINLSAAFDLSKESADILMKCAAYIKLAEFVMNQMNNVDNHWEEMEKEIKGHK